MSNKGGSLFPRICEHQIPIPPASEDEAHGKFLLPSRTGVWQDRKPMNHPQTGEERLPPTHIHAPTPPAKGLLFHFFYDCVFFPVLGVITIQLYCVFVSFPTCFLISALIQCNLPWKVQHNLKNNWRNYRMGNWNVIFFLSNSKSLTLGIWQVTCDGRVYVSSQNIINILIELGLLMNFPHLSLWQTKVISFTWTNIKTLLSIVKLNKSMVVSGEKTSFSFFCTLKSF